MHLVYGDRGIDRRTSGPARHPVPVAPFVSQVPDHRSGPWGTFGGEGERVCLFEELSSACGDGEFVDVAVTRGWDDPGPDPRGGPRAQWVGGGVPAVEVPDDADVPGTGCPDGEHRPVRADQMAAELLRQPCMGPFVEEVDVGFGELPCRGRS